MNQLPKRSTATLAGRHLLPALWIGVVALIGACGLQDPPTRGASDAPPASGEAAREVRNAPVDATLPAPPADRRLVPAPAGYAFRFDANGSVRADNPRHGLAGEVGSTGTLVVAPAAGEGEPGWSVALSLDAVGRTGSTRPAPAVTGKPNVTGGVARHRRGDGLEEWFANGPLGFEHGFELAAPPADSPDLGRDASRPVTLKLSVAGDLVPAPSARPDTLSLRTADGDDRLHYGALVAWDADGRVLPSQLKTDGASILLEIDDRGARYPLVVDPLVWVHDQKLTQSSAGTSNDQLGWSVSVSGDTAVVGAHGNDENGVDAGAAYVYVRSPAGWTQQQKITPSDAEAEDYFGYAVALDGDTMLVGAYGDDDGGDAAGAVYVFVHSSGAWIEQQKLVPASAQSEDYFGIAVGLRGDRAVVGASGDDEGGSMAGAAYVFERTGGSWQQDAKLTASDGSAQDQFGVAVSIDGTTTIVGAHGDDDQGSMSGSAYVFEHTGSDWGQVAKLAASDGASLDRFGAAVSIWGDSAVVGAYLANPSGADSGAAYVFSRTSGSWTEEQKLTPHDGATQSYFGTSVSIHGDTVLVGANGDDEAGTDAGGAYLFRRDAGVWTEHAKVVAADGAQNDIFGVAVALDAQSAVVGATGDDDTGSASGAAYMLGRDQGGPDAWGEEAKVVARDGVAREYLGYAVAVDADTAVAAGYGASDAGLQTGAVYVFERNGTGWQTSARLTAEGGAAEDRFGFALAVSGDTVVVGAYQNDDVDAEAGSAYVFERSGGTWVQRAKLLASDATLGDRFGVSVAIDGDTILVGAHGEDDGGSSTGAVYVFSRSGADWVETQRLKASDAAAGDSFGRVVAIDGDVLIAGAQNDDDGATNAGAAYVFVREGGTWTEQAKLTASDPGEAVYFGSAVDVEGGLAVVGAYLSASPALDSGAAYVFARNGSSWDQQAKIVAGDGEAEDRFGRSVAVAGGRVLVGSYFDDDKGTNSGSVYVFEEQGSSWVERQKLTADDAAANDYFGFAVAASGTTAVIGSYGDDDKGGASGAVYALELRKSLSDLCGAGAECESGYCVDGVCCELPSCPDCHSCAFVGEEGRCAPVPAFEGMACGDSTESPCTQPDTCDGAGVCQPNHTAAGAACGDSESTDCTEPDTCDGHGTCLPNHAAAGAPCGDDDETSCTRADTCNGEGTCAPNHEPDGTQCIDGSCEDGVCVGEGGAAGAAGAAGSSGTGGSGGSGGTSAQGGTGAGSGDTASSGEDDSGCGCRVAGSRSRDGSVLAALVVLALLSRRRSPTSRGRRRGALAFATASTIVLAGCGDSGSDNGSSGTPQDGGTAEAGPDASADVDAGGQGGAGGTDGGHVCPEDRQCGLTCCPASETCVNGQCVPDCPAPQSLCGDPPVCCAPGEQCYQGACVAGCEAPRVLCGDAEVVCCDEGDVCFNRQCVMPGNTCLDFADCGDQEYCEPTLGVCLPAGALPSCEYRPPVGEFSPLVEWRYSPSTAPYVRSSAAASPQDVCAAGMPLAFPDPDESTVQVSLGNLSVPFFDQPRNGMLVSTNGWLTFDVAHAGGPAPVNLPLASDDVPDALVAPYWDDLTNVTGCVLVDETEAKVVVQWRGQVAGTGEWIRFQASLYATTHAEAGLVELAYLETGATQDGDGATVGISETTTGRSSQHGFDRNGAVAVGTTLRYRYVPLRNRFDALSPPAVFDVDGDGRPEVIFAAYDETTTLSGMPNDAISGMQSGVLTILNGEDGTIQHRPVETPGYQGYLGAGAALSVGDLDGDGEVEIVGVGLLDPTVEDPSYIKAFRADGTLLWVSSVDVGFNHNGWGGGVHIADFDGDGLAEIYFARSVFNHEGDLLWSQPVEYGSPATTAADVDGDGDLELLSDRSAWQHDGTVLWERSDLGAYHFPSVADFDMDGTPEVALVSSGAVIILNGADGTTFWGPTPLETPGGGPLNIGDFDGDGYPEIGTAGEGLYLVLDLQCTGDPLPAGCDREGVRWSSPTKDISSNVTGSSLFDFEGDGVAEVVYSDECFTRVYSGTDGQVLFEASVNTRTATEYPLVADVDGDNNAEILVVANEHVLGCNTAPWNMGILGTPWRQADYRAPFCTTSLCGHRGLAVYGDALDNWVRTRRVWSGHAYHITNVLSSGAIPPVEAPNWLNPGQNNFRMNAQGSALFSAPDLEVDLQVDEATCPAKLRLRADVSNTGALGVSFGVDVAFFKRAGTQWECLGVVKTAEDLLPGSHTEVTLDYVLENEIDQDLEFRAVVDSTCDGEGKNNECESGGEDNNESEASGRCESVAGPA